MRNAGVVSTLAPGCGRKVAGSDPGKRRHAGTLAARWGNLPVPPDPLHWSASRTDGSGTRSRGYLRHRRVRVLIRGGEDALQRGSAGEGAAARVDVRLELVPEAVDIARDRHRSRVAERAQALAEDAV